VSSPEKEQEVKIVANKEPELIEEVEKTLQDLLEEPPVIEPPI
jgi:hypothetical protein